MFGIVSTVSSIERVIDSNCRWKRIIESSRRIFLYKDKDIENIELSMLSRAGLLSFDDEIKEFPSRSLFERYPECAFLFDTIENQTALSIQSQYGVICQTIDNLDDSILTHIDPDHFEMTYNEGGYNWEKICEGLLNPRMPSNCVIINDRNMFVNDDTQEGFTPGLDNLHRILDCLLPKSFSEELNAENAFPYHVLIGCELKQLKYSYNSFASKINGIKKRLQRPYPINIEFIAITSDNDFFRETHNRRIYSNYYTISCDHKLAAFAGTKSRCSQSFDVLKLYSKYDKEKSAQPVIGHDYFIKKLSESVHYWMQKPKTMSTYSFSQNGDCRPVINKIKNRLLVQYE